MDGKELVDKLRRFAESPSYALYWCSYKCPDCGTWLREKMTIADMQLRRPCSRCRERN